MDAVSVIILAAGEGTRMHSSKPKVLHEVCGYSMLAHVLNEALKTSDDICVVLGHKFDEVSAHLNENFSYEMRK
ncbi:MAG: fused N-acetylglucosamine-1-phosphate uridyltransferase and glucosamine-1-phosphate acetyltransferase, partial [Candidatus Campylobacter infans]